MRLYLIRTIFEDEQTLGNLLVIDDNAIIQYGCKTLELGWKYNEKYISCIPKGTYRVELEYSPDFDAMLYELKGVENRSEIKIHNGNFYDQIKGCILVGDSHDYIDGDIYKDVTNSKRTLERLHRALGGIKETYITIL